MKKINYASIAQKLLGDELYLKLISEIAKENNNSNLVDFGKQTIEKMCLIIIMLGMSKTVKLDNVKICVGSEVIKISCKEFAKKYKKYFDEISINISKTLKNT